MTKQWAMMSGLGYRVGQKFVRNLKMDSSEFFYEPSVNPNCPISDSILALVREFAFVVDLQPTSLLRKRKTCIRKENMCCITSLLDPIVNCAPDNNCDILVASTERRLNHLFLRLQTSLGTTSIPRSEWMMTIFNRVLLFFLLLHGVLIQFSATAYHTRPVASTRTKSQSSSESVTLKYRMRSLSVANTPEKSATNSMSSKLFRLENLPLVGITVGIIAFSFQLSVLYPWHIELHRDFTALEVTHTISSR
jgi:hypothetical protein